MEKGERAGGHEGGIQVCYAQILTPHRECKHHVLQSCENKKNIKPRNHSSLLLIKMTEHHVPYMAFVVFIVMKRKLMVRIFSWVDMILERSINQAVRWIRQYSKFILWRSLLSV